MPPFRLAAAIALLLVAFASPASALPVDNDNVKYNADWSLISYYQLPAARKKHAAAVYQGKIYLVGGEDASGALISTSAPGFSVMNDVRGASADFPVTGAASCFPAAGVAEGVMEALEDAAAGKLLYAGGINSNKICVMDIATATWTDSGATLGGMATLSGASSMVWNNLMYISGGTDGTTVQSTYGSISPTGAFTPLAIPDPDSALTRAYHGFVVNENMRGFILMGSPVSVPGTACTADVFENPDVTNPANSYAKVTPDAASVTPVGRCGAAIAFHNGHVLVFGGSATVMGTPEATVQLWQPGMSRWYHFPGGPRDLFLPRLHHSLAIVYDRFYVHGGMTGASGAVAEVEVSDNQVALPACFAGQEYNNDPTTVTFPTSPMAGVTLVPGLPHLPTRTEDGFTFQVSAFPTPDGNCWQVGQCMILSKANCGGSLGAFWFGISAGAWTVYSAGSAFPFTFPTPSIDTPNRFGCSGACRYNLVLTWEGSGTSRWTLSVNGEMNDNDVVSQPNPEGPVHDVQIGGCESTQKMFDGQLRDVYIGACTKVDLVRLEPGLGASGVPASTSLKITVTNPTIVRPFIADVKYITVTDNQAAVQRITTKQFDTWYNYSTHVTSTVTFDPVLNASVRTFELHQNPDFSIVWNNVYQIGVDFDFFKDLYGQFPAIEQQDWKFSTRNRPVPTHEECRESEILVQMDPKDWSFSHFCDSIQRVTFSVPCENIQMTLYKGYETHMLQLRFAFRRMAPGTCVTVLDHLDRALGDGTLHHYIINQRPELPFGTGIHPGGYAVEKKETNPANSVARLDWGSFSVKNVPDTTSSATAVTINIQPGDKLYTIPNRPVIIGVSFPMDWVMAANTSLNWNMEVCSGTSTCQPATGSPNLEGTYIEWEFTPVAFGGDLTNAEIRILNGATMPSSCYKLNAWVWTVKVIDKASGRLENFMIRNPITDRCQGKSVMIWGDPHFSSFSGGEYDVNGVTGRIYNIVSDKNFQWNSQFVSLNPKAAMHTYLGPVGIKVNGTKVFADPKTGVVTVNGEEVTQLDTRVSLGQGSPYYLKISAGVLYIRAPGFLIGLKTVLKDHGKVLPHFDQVVSLTNDAASRINPHGLLGQTVHFKEPVRATGHQGEGVIEGGLGHYEVAELFGDDFKFNRYMQ